MGLKESINVDIFRQWKGGMRWHEMVRKVKQLLTIADSPTILIVHCGGNDMGLISSKTLREKNSTRFTRYSGIASLYEDNMVSNFASRLVEN